MQGCSLFPILFSVFIDDLLREVEKAEPWDTAWGW